MLICSETTLRAFLGLTTGHVTKHECVVDVVEHITAGIREWRKRPMLTNTHGPSLDDVARKHPHLPVCQFPPLLAHLD